MKLLAVLVLVFSLISCEKKSEAIDKVGSMVQETKISDDYTVQDKNNQSNSAEERIFTFDPVITIEDEFIPLLNTNVFVKTADESLAEEIHQDLITYHKLVDQYHYYTENNATSKNLKIVNDHIHQKESIVLDEKLFNLLRDSIDLMPVTHGYFNPFINPVLELYDGKFSPFPIENADPKAEDIKNALKTVLSYEQATENFIFDESSYTLSFKNVPEVSLNVGAISKGFIAEEIAKKYRNGTYLLNLGNSTIYGQGRDYKIGVQSPYNNRGALFHINLPSGLSLSTSGTTNNYYILQDDGKTIRTHLIDPYTGYSNDYYWSVTIVSDSAMLADALTTALFNVGDTEEAMEIIEATRKAYGCTLEACFVKELSRRREEVELLMTDGFQIYIDNEYKDASVVDKKIIGK